MLITNNTAQDYYFGPIHLAASAVNFYVDDTTDTSLYLTDDRFADAINTLSAAGAIAVTPTPGQVFPRAVGEPSLMHGDGSPEGLVYAPQGSLFMRRDAGSATNCLYTKTTGIHINTGWVALGTSVGVKVATTVAGLGAGVDGGQGRLRLGSSPFEFLDLVYDATLGHWVSPQEAIATAVGTMAASSAADQWNLGVGSLLWKPYLAAGLTPQFNITGRTRAASASVNDLVGFTVYHLSTYQYPGSVPNDLTSLLVMQEQRAQTTANQWVGFGDYNFATFTLTPPGSPKDLMIVGASNNGTLLGNIDVALTCWLRWIA